MSPPSVAAAVVESSNQRSVPEDGNKHGWGVGVVVRIRRPFDSGLTSVRQIVNIFLSIRDLWVMWIV